MLGLELGEVFLEVFVVLLGVNYTDEYGLLKLKGHDILIQIFLLAAHPPDDRQRLDPSDESLIDHIHRSF